MAGNNLAPRQFNAYGLASLYLRTAGLPDTSLNRRILAAWFMSESKRVGQTDILVYNNNPLNITCRSCSDYHQFNGIGLKFANYSGTTAGAQAWANLVRGSYPGIYFALKAQDHGAFRSALAGGPPHWGTNASTWGSVFNNLSSQMFEGQYPNYGDSSNLQQGPPVPQLSAFNGLYSKPLGSTFTDQDVSAIMKILEDNHWFDANNPLGIISTPIAEATFAGILNKHRGEAWTPELLAKLAAETGVAAVQAGNTNPANAIPGVQALNDLNATLGKLTNGANLFHVVAIALGFGLVFYGLKVIFRSANVEGISSGNSGGNSTTIIESETRYPMVIKDEAPQLPTPAPKPAIRRSRRSVPQSEWPEPVDNTALNPASNTIAPLKQASA